MCSLFYTIWCFGAADENNNKESYLILPKFVNKLFRIEIIFACRKDTTIDQAVIVIAHKFTSVEMHSLVWA